MKDKPWFATYATRKATKSYECKVKNGGGAKKKKKNKKQTSKLSNSYTNKVDKKASTPYLLKKKKKWQGGGHQGEQASQQWEQMYLSAKGDHFQHEEHQEGLIPKGKWEVRWTSGNLET